MVRDLIDGGAYHWYLDRGCDYLKRDIFEYNNGSWTENTALTHAQERGHVEIVAMLLEAGATGPTRCFTYVRSGMFNAKCKICGEGKKIHAKWAQSCDRRTSGTAHP